MNKLIAYMKCSTCIKAKKHLDNLNVEYEIQDIKLDNPDEVQIDKLIKLSGLDINKFFNTSGLVYKSLNLKDKIKTLSYEDKIKLLASDGMLVKRPILLFNDQVIVGYKQEVYEKISN